MCHQDEVLSQCKGCFSLVLQVSFVLPKYRLVLYCDPNIESCTSQEKHQSTRVLGMGVEQALCLVPINAEALP
jgi:hypothetical protein